MNRSLKQGPKRCGESRARAKVVNRHVMSVRLPGPLHRDLKTMSEATYRPINSLLVEFARDRVRDWKEKVAAARRPGRSRRHRPFEAEEEVEDEVEK